MASSGNCVLVHPVRRALATLALASMGYGAIAWLSPGVHTYDARNVVTPCLRVSPGLEHWGQPGCSGLSQVGSKEAELHFNSQGIRDREYGPRAADGVYRILVLGSSNFLGPGIAEADTFPRQLERELQRTGRRVEVINGAMTGYCPSQMALRVPALLGAYSPDLVLLQFVQGSCPLFDGAWADRVAWEGGRPVALDRSPIRGGRYAAFNSFVYAHPALFFLWLTVADGGLKARFAQRYLAPRGHDARVEAFLRPSIRFLASVRDQARARGAELAVFSYKMRPFTQSIPEQMYAPLAKLLAPLIRAPDSTGEELIAHVRNAGFRVVYDGTPTEEFLVPGDVHLNEAGLAKFAGATARELAPLVPRNRR